MRIFTVRIGDDQRAAVEELARLARTDAASIFRHAVDIGLPVVRRRFLDNADASARVAAPVSGVMENGGHA